MTETLKRLVISKIQKTELKTLAEFMAKVLHNKNFGYYATREPLGSIGDCTTAPEIPQIFGKLTGLRVLHSLQQREFLITMRINERAERLKHGSSTQQINDIDIALKCLTDRKEMVEIFKFIGFTPKMFRRHQDT
tara:strand:+ start:188 stop:592 length:405 start_codon:yes stop_codon:yes gene_type:complete